MEDSLWVLEFRHRERKNGKWSKWSSMEAEYRPATAYRSYPADQVFSYDKYERRAVEYIRKPEAANGR